MRTTSFAVAVGAFAALLVGCPPASPPSVPPGVTQPGGDPGGPPAPPPPPSPPPSSSPPDAGGLRADGEACDQSSDCAGGICEGLGCGEGEGVCASSARGCTRDYVTYCGCDGATFHGSGSCPGRRYAYRGECAEPRADGQPCESGDQCESGVCEGQGCDRGALGVCVPAGRMCTADVVSFCDCRGRSFQGSSSCPGRRYAARGDCPR